MRNKRINKKVFLFICIALIAVIFAFLLFSFVTGRISFGALEDGWDGSSVATSFEFGNGSQENPYIINSPEEFMYFRNLIEGADYASYQDKYYVLGNDLNFNDFPILPIGLVSEEEERVFTGVLDGAGHIIQNLRIIEPSVFQDTKYYGLFAKTKNVTIRNLNIDGFTIAPEENTDKVVIGSLIVDNENDLEEKSHFSDISIRGLKLDLDTLELEDNEISIFANHIGENSVVEKIYLDGEISNNKLEYQPSFIAKNDGEVSSIVSNFDVVTEEDTIQQYYLKKEQEYYLNNELIDADTIVSLFNESIDSKYYWEVENGVLIIKIYAPIAVDEIPEIQKKFSFSILKSPTVALHDSGIVESDSTVYINDLVSDYNYYKGLNYTDYRDTGTLPTGVNRNLYNDSNLVKVYVMYDGSDLNNTNAVGYVSLDEQISKFVYYKYYTYKNGYLEFELIDNPFADRPDNLFFQGWATDYAGAIISYDADTYVRKVRVPVHSDIVNITFHAVWGKGTVYTLNSASNWNNVVNNLDTLQMKQIGSVQTVVEPDVNTLYVTGRARQYTYYPAGAVDYYGNPLTGFCWSASSYYILNTAAYSSNTTYYQLTDTGMQVFTDFVNHDIFADVIPSGYNVAGYYRKVIIPRYSSIAGYYNEDGEYQSGGTCNTNGGCDYYELLQYYDIFGNPNISNGQTFYYYLVTRDTNVVVLNTTMSGYSLTNNRPMTITGIHNGRRYNGVYTLTSTYIRPSADLRIEYITMNSNVRKYTEQTNIATGTNSSAVIYGNWQNVKIGRGIVHSDNTFSAATIIGGSNGGTGSSDSLTRYRLIVESGYYNFGATVNAGATNTYTNSYVDGYAIWGSDFDRIADMNRETIPNPDKLDVYYAIAGSWSTNIYSDSTQTGMAIHTTIKSGVFGSSKYDYSTGAYVGGRLRNTSHNAAREMLVEGGYIYNLVGGPLGASNRSNINDIYINIKGGEIDQVTAGAGLSATYGHRVVSITGGKVNYSVFGGSNGSEGTNGDGTINGSSFLYIGGDAVIGDEDLIENGSTLDGAEAGSIFGIGNGRSGYSSIGAMKSSYIVIADEANINGNVYGGGNYGYVGTSNPAASTIQILNGHIHGSVYGGGNNNGSGTNQITSTININVNGGTVDGSVYGGSKSNGTIYGSTNVTINGGTIGKDVYGGGEGGYVRTNSPGTYVRENANVIINDGLIKGSVYGGSAFGTVNAINQTATSSNYKTNVTVNGGVVQQNVFGGGKGDEDFTPRVVGDITVRIENGSVGSVFGGFDASGKPSAGDIVYLDGGVVGNAYGGGNNANQDETDIRLLGSTVTGNIYGGSNLLGTVTSSSVTIDSGSVTNVFGGNNMDGLTVSSHVVINGGNISANVYGGGNQADSTQTDVKIYAGPLNAVFGGGESAGVSESTTITVYDGSITQLYGGSNQLGDVDETNIVVQNTSTDGIQQIFGGNNEGGTTSTSNIDVTAGIVGEIYGGGNKVGVTTTNVNVAGGTITDVFGGSNQSGDVDTSNVTIGDASHNVTIGSVYGGNNEGGETSSANVTVDYGTINTVFGGGNSADVGETHVEINGGTIEDVYGGGNAASVLANTFLDLNSATVTNNIYGGGNEGVVEGDTSVFVTDSSIAGNAFAGGNGATAVVHNNSAITIDGTTVIGTASTVAPDAGCVFGSGNAASTGIEGVEDSKSTVNIVGGTIYGNVYGGPKMAIVYGTSETNIGTSSVSGINGLKEDNILIHGTVFGGGESNASGSESFDWTFISVTKGIDVNIDGTGYLDHSHSFVINGSIFGSGNASSSAGQSNIYIKNLGTFAQTNKAISIQRTNYLEIESSVIELSGTTDRTNEISDMLYSFNIIDKMVIKNGTTLLLQHNANLLKEFYSGVDFNGSLVPAVVDIDDENKTITKNVDNRVYMLPGENLHIATNQYATAYGRVTGMTFFGMYNSYDNGSYRYGLYSPSLSYGDSGNAGLEIIGGSYVIGAHHDNHDITKDGFYSNYLNDDFTEVTTAYIDPARIGDTGYRWTIGFEAINYTVNLIASKYSSLGTVALQLIDFGEGNTIFDVLGFDSSGLDENIVFVDSNNVPRLGATEEEANRILGLSMKAETQEWTGYGTTKLLSANQGEFTGDFEYTTDARKIAPSLMFYLYHAKNINLSGNLGECVITMQAAIPKNAIEYDIKFLTITVTLTANNDASDSYDAAITYDKKYELPSATDVFITNQSQFTAYYSLTTFKDEFSKVYGNNNDFFHVLVTDYALPVNTMITMLDYGTNPNRPEYYYYRVTQSVYDDSLQQLQNYNEITYRLNNFIKMDSTSTNNKYDDALSNLHYYNSDTGLVDEEFIFIFDFKECTQVTGEHKNNTMLFELRTGEDRTVYSVLGLREPLMRYSTFESSNVVLQQTITDVDSYLYYNVNDEFNYETEIQYNLTGNNVSIIDTNYESSRMGLNVVFLDKDGEQVSSSLLIGTSITIGGREYFADGDGVYRIKLANKVSNLNRTASITVNKDLPAGKYKIRYTLFASSDGLHNSAVENSVSDEFDVTVVSADNSIAVDCDDKIKIVDGQTGLNLNNTKINTYLVKYESQLSNPNFRIEVFKRDTSDIDTTGFTSIPFNTLFTNSLTSVRGNEVAFDMGEEAEKSFDFTLQDNLTSGTYRIVFRLYDNDQLIDDDIKYVIVLKNHSTS